MRIGFLGLGKMGTPMARHLLAAGHELRVWNRSEGRTEPLLREGAIAAGTPAEAELGADAVITMLFDDAANEEVIFGANGLMDALSPGALHISCSTISVELSERLTQEHARHKHEFVAAPVFGRPNVAEQGKLWVVGAGAEHAVAKARPLLETFSRGISLVGTEPREAHAVKLGGNFLISAMLYSLSEAFVYADGQGIEPAVFFEAVNSALFQSPFYAAYSRTMLNPPAEAGASILLGEKDTRLLREAAASRGTRVKLADTLAEIFAQAKAAGLANQDWAVGMYRMSQQGNKTRT
ncbi:MAG: NAD(P)-dependent oxidoreductase [Terracidiphilus sp.]|jgi:3-hydroxyisobutyrate dehydrogenase-like beta-hydroxyacid dehydrogenase